MPQIKRKVCKRRLPACSPELLAWWLDDATPEQHEESVVALFLDDDEVANQWADVRTQILPFWLRDPKRFARQIELMRCCRILCNEDEKKLGMVTQ